MGLRAALLYRPPEVTVPGALQPRAIRDRTGHLWRLRLGGTPEQIGHDHAQLGEPLMQKADEDMVATYRQVLPSAALRLLIGTFVRLRHRQLDRDIPVDHRRELAAMARTYRDPYAG